MKRVAVLLALAACGGAAKSAGPSANGVTEQAMGKSAEAAHDAGTVAPRACLRESKDPMPCSEDCDRGIAMSCVILAQRSHSTWAVRLYERACDLQDASSCATAARHHANGDGVPRSRPKQMELLAKACLFGQTEACATPAKAFATGNGVPRDERRAHELWERGCGGGFEAACDALGDAGL